MDSDLIVNVFRDWHHVRKLSLWAYKEFQKEWDLLVIKLEGELNYLTSESHIEAMKKIEQATTIVLGFGYTSVMDLDAQEELEHLIIKRLKEWKEIYITWLREQNLSVMQHGTVYHQLAESWHIYESKSALLEKILG